jgi:three-Cys-motif partner protein
MPALADSDREKWNYDLHTRIKHEILMRYLSVWTTVLGQSTVSLAYVDAFAGKGRYTTGQLGSPLLAIGAMLGAMEDRKVSASGVSFHFVEPNQANFQDLQRELSQYPPAQDPRVKCHVYPTAFSSVCDTIAAEIQRKGQPSFFFVDPFGYDDIPMEVLGRILCVQRAEVFINLMYDFASRAIGVVNNPALARTLDGLFGTPAWRTVGELARETREKEFVTLYRQQLKRACPSYVLPFRMGDDARDRTLYYLMHATKHIKGVRIMKDVMVASSSPGHLGYAGEARHQMVPLFDFCASDLPFLLQRRFAGQTLSFNQVLERSIEDTGTCREPEYRACLKELERARRIKVERVTSKTTRGLGGEDRIAFPDDTSVMQNGFNLGS